MARITDVIRSFSGGEVAPELKSLKGSDFFKNSALLMQNYMPRPQGRMTSRPSLDHLSNLTGVNISNMIRLNNSDGTGKVFIIQDLSNDPGTIEPVIGAYDGNGHIGYDIDFQVSELAANQKGPNSNELLLTFTTPTPPDPNQYISLYVEIEDVANNRTIRKTLDNVRVGPSGAGTRTFFISDPEIEAIPSGTRVIYDNVRLVETQPIASTQLVLIQNGQKVVPPISYTQVEDVLYIVNGELDVPLQIEFNEALNNGDKITFQSLAVTSTTNDVLVGINEPTAIGFYEQRLVLGKENNIAFSQVSDFANFNLGTNTTDAMFYSIAGLNNNVADIRWIQATEKFLLVGTSTGNFVVRGAGEYAAITPNSLQINPIDSLGSEQVNPVISDARVYFVERDSENIRSLEFNFQIRGYNTQDMNLLAKHIGREKVKRIVFYQKEPNRIVAVLENGELAVMVVGDETSRGVFYRIKHGAGKIVDIEVAFDGDGGDCLFAVVENTIFGGAKQFNLEKLDIEKEYKVRDQFFTGDKGADDQAYAEYLKEQQITDLRLDSKRSFSQEIRGVTTLSQFDAFNFEWQFIGISVDDTDQRINVGDKIIETNGPGEGIVTSVRYYESDTITNNRIVVQILDNNKQFSTNSFNTGDLYLAKQVYSAPEWANQTVALVLDSQLYLLQANSNGTVDASNVAQPDNPESARGFVGIPFWCIYKSMPLIAVSGQGQADDKIKDVANLFLDVQNSLGIEYGTDLYNLETIQFRKETDSLFEQVPYFTGQTEPLYLEGNSEREVCMFIVQRTPFPANILSMSYDITATTL